MKKTEFVMERGIEKMQFKRGVEIEGNSSNLVVELTLNNKKGIFAVHGGLTSQQITGRDTLDRAALKSILELEMEAIKYGLNWKGEWLAARKPEDGDGEIGELGFGNQNDEEE